MGFVTPLRINQSTQVMVDKVSIRGCKGFLFLEHFMTNLLPSEVDYAKTKANSESVDDAILFIQDSLDRFHIYQGHRARVCNT
jgi:hypothetical protein